MTPETQPETYTIQEIASAMGYTRIGIFKAIYEKRLKAQKHGSEWIVNIKDFDEYYKNRYDRKFSKFEGKPRFDKEQGQYSIIEASKIIGCPEQDLYYACRTGKMQSTRKGSSWVVQKDEIDKYKQKKEAKQASKTITRVCPKYDERTRKIPDKLFTQCGI